MAIKSAKVSNCIFYLSTHPIAATFTPKDFCAGANKYRHCKQEIGTKHTQQQRPQHAWVDLTFSSTKQRHGAALVKAVPPLHGVAHNKHVHHTDNREQTCCTPSLARVWDSVLQRNNTQIYKKQNQHRRQACTPNPI